MSPQLASGCPVLLETATGISSRPDNRRERREIYVNIVIVPGLGRHLCSSSAGMASGIATKFQPGHPRLAKDDIVVPLQQPHAGNGLCTFDVNINADESVPKASSTPSMAMTAEASADIWYRCLGYTDLHRMGLLRKKSGNGVSFRGTIACDSCAVIKSQPKVNPKQNQHTTISMELVNDVIGPIKPAVKGGLEYISTSINGFIDIKEVFLLKSNLHASKSVHQYNMTVAVPLGLRIQLLRSDKGGENRRIIQETLR